MSDTKIDHLEKLSPKDLTAVLIKHYDLHEGVFDLSIEFCIGTGISGPSPESMYPTAMIGVSTFSLILTEIETPFSVDAAVVNPAKKTTKKK